MKIKYNNEKDEKAKRIKFSKEASALEIILNNICLFHDNNSIGKLALLERDHNSYDEVMRILIVDSDQEGRIASAVCNYKKDVYDEHGTAFGTWKEVEMENIRFMQRIASDNNIQCEDFPYLFKYLETLTKLRSQYSDTEVGKFSDVLKCAQVILNLENKLDIEFDKRAKEREEKAAVEQRKREVIEGVRKRSASLFEVPQKKEI